jgi:hypothetical protein
MHFVYVQAINRAKAWDNMTATELALFSYYNLKYIWLKVMSIKITTHVFQYNFLFSKSLCSCLSFGGFFDSGPWRVVLRQWRIWDDA